MKHTTYFALAALACLCVSQPASGQTLKQPASVRPVATDTTYYYLEDEPSPSDVQQPVVEGSEEFDVLGECTSCGGVGGCDDCGGGWRLFPHAECCEPWTLLPPLPGGFTLTGWLDVGATANADSPASRFNGPLAFNDQNEFQVNQLYAVLERQANTGGSGWDWGARVDVLFGTDYVFNQMTGWETFPNGANRWNAGPDYGLVTPQAYGEVAYNRLSMKVGRFYTIIGYENTRAVTNFFYSHSYTLMYGEPFMHTGGLLTFEGDVWTLYGGLVNGWDQFDGLSDNLAFLAGATYAPCHGAYTISGSIISGEEGVDLGGPYTPRTMYSLVFDWHVTDRVEYVLQHDLGWQEAVFAGGQQDAEWYGINQYLYYTLNDCWRFGARLEWFRDDDGFRVTGSRTGNPFGGGLAGNYYAATLGANWIPSLNVIVRPEVRWDWFDGNGLPYDDGTSDDQFTAAVDVILRF